MPCARSASISSSGSMPGMDAERDTGHVPGFFYIRVLGVSPHELRLWRGHGFILDFLSSNVLLGVVLFRSNDPGWTVPSALRPAVGNSFPLLSMLF